MLLYYYFFSHSSPYEQHMHIDDRGKLPKAFICTVIQKIYLFDCNCKKKEHESLVKRLRTCSSTKSDKTFVRASTEQIALLFTRNGCLRRRYVTILIAWSM